MSNKKAVVKIGADVEEAKKGIEVDDPPKIAGRYTYIIIEDISSHLKHLLFQKHHAL